MARFKYTICLVPGKMLYTADALSKDPMLGQEPTPLQEEMEIFVDSVTR